MNKLSKYYFLKCFESAIKIYNFKILAFTSNNYYIHVKLISELVGIDFSFEYREPIAWITFVKLKADGIFKDPVGEYTIKNLYTNPDYKCRQFTMGSILSLKYNLDQKNLYLEVKTIEQIIRKAAELSIKYAKEFIEGQDKAYDEMDKILRDYLSVRGM